jgi:hypothetical protein
VLLTGSESLASQRLLVALLHLDVAALQLESPGQSTAGPHSWEVFRRVHSEHVAQNFGQYWREPSHMKIHRIDAHQDKPQTVLAVRATRQIRKTEEAAFDVVLVLGDRGRCHQLAHQSPCRSSVGLDQRGFLIRALGVPERAMHHIQRVPKLFLFRDARLGVRN